jgi:hypothetical protein
MSTLTHCDGGRGFGSTKTDILLTPRPSLPCVCTSLNTKIE